MRIKSTDVMKAVVLSLGLAGALAIVVLAPNLPIVFAQFYKAARKLKPGQIKRTLAYMKSRELVVMRQEGNKTIVRLTEGGEQKLLKYRLEDMKLPRPKRWDKKWRLIFFDIPEKYKLKRDTFSSKLKEIGMVPIQKSVWIWPYDCKKEIDVLKEAYEIRPFVRMATVDEIDRERELIKSFGII